MTKQELTSKLIGLPFNEITPQLFALADNPYYSSQEQWEIITMRYFGGNQFAILNLIWKALLNFRVILNSDNSNSQTDQANSELDNLTNIFYEIETILNYFPKA